MIPHVRPWRVTFFREGREVARVTVHTVNRRFARWLALEQFPVGFAAGVTLRVSRIK